VLLLFLYEADTEAEASSSQLGFCLAVEKSTPYPLYKVTELINVVVSDLK